MAAHAMWAKLPKIGSNTKHLNVHGDCMDKHTIVQRLQKVADDYDFYTKVGDFSMAQYSLDRWVYLNSLIEGGRHVA